MNEMDLRENVNDSLLRDMVAKAKDMLIDAYQRGKHDALERERAKGEGHYGDPTGDCNAFGNPGDARQPPPPPDAVERVLKAARAIVSARYQVLSEACRTRAGDLSLEHVEELHDALHEYDASLRATTGQPETGRGEIGQVVRNLLYGAASEAKVTMVSGGGTLWNALEKRLTDLLYSERAQFDIAILALQSAQARAEAAEATVERASEQRRHDLALLACGSKEGSANCGTCRVCMQHRAEQAEAARDEAEKALRRTMGETGA